VVSDILSFVLIEVVLSGGRFIGVRDMDRCSPGAFVGVGGKGSVFIIPGLNSGSVVYIG
jgi:hypothetical protein